MPISVVLLLMALASTPAVAFDADKHDVERAGLADGRFELEVSAIQPVPASADGRFKLDSGFDPEAIRPVSDGRYSLSSELQGKSALGACGAQPDLVFANGFEGP